MSIDTNNFSFATFISINNGDYFGSGFRIVTDKYEYIITAKHVIFSQDKLLSEIWVKSRNYYGETYDAFDINIDLTEENVRTFGNSDIALIILHEKFGLHINTKGHDISFAELGDLKKFDDVRISENIYLIGFPSSLVTKDDFYENDRPLLRYGIVAGKNVNNNTFVIDSIAYYGVSGGPIVSIDANQNISIIGIVSRYIPFITEWKNKYELSLIRHDFYNSGYAVCERLDEIINFIEIYENDAN
jgi:hypothetical protein